MGPLEGRSWNPGRRQKEFSNFCKPFEDIINIIMSGETKAFKVRFWLSRVSTNDQEIERLFDYETNFTQSLEQEGRQAVLCS